MGEEIRVFRNDAIDVKALRALRPGAVILSPGPGRPEDAGITLSAIRELSATVPMLGVCLGHQAIASAFGGRVEGVASGFEAGRYHSLVADRTSLPAELRVTAWTGDGTVMGLRHVDRPLHGVQFHPESVLTPEGDRLLRNFLRLARET
jgi:anthranilate/para-aminobenzoate synthase component II